MSFAASTIPHALPSRWSSLRQIGGWAREIRNLRLGSGRIKVLLSRSSGRSDTGRPQRRVLSQGGSSSAMTTVAGIPPVGYRPNVGVCLVNKKDEVWVGSRRDLPGSWQMPQGGVDEGEEPQDAAFRELREETGITSAEMLGEVPEWLTYDFPPDVKARITTLWGKEWTGQAQKWFLFRFKGEDTEVNLDGDDTEPPEFVEWSWMRVDDVIMKDLEPGKPWEGGLLSLIFKLQWILAMLWSQLDTSGQFELT